MPAHFIKRGLLDKTKPISMANTTEHLESAESIRNQSGFPLSSAERQMKLQLRVQGGGPGIRGHGFPDPGLSPNNPIKTLYKGHKHWGQLTRVQKTGPSPSSATSHLTMGKQFNLPSLFSHPSNKWINNCYFHRSVCPRHL